MTRTRVTYLLRYYLTTVLLFIAAKVVFLLVCHDAVPVLTMADVKDVVVHGLSLDLSTALYFLIVPFLVVMASVWVRVPRWVLRTYNAVVAVALALAFVADTSLYPFWGFKLDASCLQYLETPEGITQSVSVGYLVMRFLALVLVAWLIYRVYTGMWPRQSKTPPAKYRLPETALYLLLMPLMVIGIRGGVTESTTNIGQVYYSQTQFLNHAAVNPVFSFLSSLGHTMGDTSQYQFMANDEAEQLAATVYTTESLHADTLLTTTRPNIVLILLESCGEEFASVMPRLQQLKQEGVCFTRCYANSWRTDRGTVCTLSGYPSFPSLSVMKMPGKSRTLPSVARTLQQEGYQTTYLYGGDINFTNMRSYLVSTGWERLVSMDDYTTAEQHTAQWGVRDDITFQTLQELIQGDGMEMRQSGEAKRFLIGYSTLSSHEPWDVPTHTHADPVLNAFAYLDSCLGDFIDRLRQTPQWQQLLVVLLADHGINYGSYGLTNPERNHIPMLWLGGVVREPRRVDALCNQTDLAATLLGQLQLPHTDYRFSRDVLSRSYCYPTAVNNQNNAQWLIDSTGCILYDFSARQFTVGQSADRERLLRLNEAILQTTTNDLNAR